MDSGGGITEHTLTFSDVTVTVDGASVTSPYTLTKNCTIVVNVSHSSSGLFDSQLTINDTMYLSDASPVSLDLSQTDIDVTAISGNGSIEATINYTA